MNENISFESLSHIKNRKNNERMFIFLYSSILLAIGISSACYGASFQNASENLLFVNIFYSMMFMSSSGIMISIWIYLFKHRFETFEAVMRGKTGHFKFLLSQRGEKVNMYLRFGLTMFGISALVYIGMRRSIRFRENSFPTSFVIFGVIQGLFIIIQTCFILFNHRLVILSHTKILKLSLVHLIITNILMWANSSIGKISSDFQKSEFCSMNKYDISCSLYIYFLPAVSEYAVIVAAILYEIYTRIGKYNLIELEKQKSKKTSVSVNPQMVVSIITGISIVFICIFTSVSSVVLHVLEVDDVWVYHFHNTEIILLNILSIIILILGYLNSKKLKFSVSMSKNSLDKNILLISYTFSLNFALLALFICGYATLSNENYSLLSIMTIRIMSGCLEIIQITMQTHFLTDAFKRCSFSTEQMEIKPGRNYIAILMGINTGMWFVYSLQIKNADIIYYKEHDVKQYRFLENSDNNVIGLLVRFFLQSTLPLAMLYRYHSSACLSDIYTKIYQTEAMRFEVHLRAGNIHKENQIFGECAISPKHKAKHISFAKSPGNHKNDDEFGLSTSKRSQSIGIIPQKVIEEVNRKQNRRETIKNMEEAHYKLMSTEISYQMLNKRMNSNLSKKLNSKTNEKPLPNIEKMVKSSFFTTKDDFLNISNDNDSAYSI